MKRVYIDYDSTLFAFDEALEGYIRSKYNVDFKMSNVVTYDFNKSISKVPFSELQDLLRDLPRDRFIASLTEIITTGECTHLLGGLTSKSILEEMSELSLYLDSRCLVNRAIFDVFCSRRSVLPIINSGVPFSEFTYDIIDIKKFRCKELFKDYPYKEAYHVGEKPVHGDAFAVIDDDLGYLSRYAEANSDALLLLIDHSYNQYKYNPQYIGFEDKIKRVKSIDEALKCVDYKLDGVI